MEQTCHRCGAIVPAEASFCGQCGAPQVRVPESLTIIGESGNLAETQEISSSAIPGTTVSWRHAWPAATSAGLAMAVALLLLSPLFPLCMLAGGWIAVILYRRRTVLPIITSSIGGKIGALAGLLGFGFFSVFFIALLTFEGGRAILRATLNQAAARNPDPQTQALVQWMQTPEGLAFTVLLVLGVFLLLSTAGGVFASSGIRRKMR